MHRRRLMHTTYLERRNNGKKDCIEGSELYSLWNTLISATAQ
jgi:hypothetical protein